MHLPTFHSTSPTTPGHRSRRLYDRPYHHNARHRHPWRPTHQTHTSHASLQTCTLLRPHPLHRPRRPLSDKTIRTRRLPPLTLLRPLLHLPQRPRPPGLPEPPRRRHHQNPHPDRGRLPLHRCSVPKRAIGGSICSWQWCEVGRCIGGVHAGALRDVYL